jgi:S-adenosylmethionine:tRNA ribosyltransferase-isomerase
LPVAGRSKRRRDELPRIAVQTNDPPTYPERLRVPATTGTRVNETHREGGRVIAIGTTVVRTLETAGREDGHAHPVDGWTDLVITPERGVSVADDLLTGWHEFGDMNLILP